MMFFLADELPTHWSYPLIWPTLLAFLAIYVYSKAFVIQKYGPAPKWKVGWLLIALFGLVLGLMQAYKMVEPVYRSVANENGLKMTYTHYLAGLAPLLTIIGVLLYDRFARPDREA
jgi:hypothetical protein